MPLENQSIILASASKSRQIMLRNAGLEFETVVSGVDEDAIKSAVAEELLLEDLAGLLAQTKASVVSETNRDKWVVGADQTLLFEGTLFDKPLSKEQARDNLLRFRGKVHRLETAVCLAKAGEIVWTHSEPAFLSVREFSNEFLGHYLASEGDDVMSSVGGYKLEGLGLQLFEKIEGDFFSILGLPMIPLLTQLRSCGAISR